MGKNSSVRLKNYIDYYIEFKSKENIPIAIVSHKGQIMKERFPFPELNKHSANVIAFVGGVKVLELVEKLDRNASVFINNTVALRWLQVGKVNTGHVLVINNPEAMRLIEACEKSLMRLTNRDAIKYWEKIDIFTQVNQTGTPCSCNLI
jgi:hypothetical protein